MTSKNTNDDRPNPVDANIGDEVDVERTAQMISSREIQALMISEEPVADRLHALKGMRSELQARLAKNHGDDLAPLADQLDRAIDDLSSAGGEAGVRSALKTD